MVDNNKEPRSLTLEQQPAEELPKEQPAGEQRETREQESAPEQDIKPSPISEVSSALDQLAHLKRRPKPVLPQVRDEVTVKIEKILEEGVGDAYSRLSPVAKQEFKLKGEETARAIRDMIKSTHVKVKKILRLILEWLKMLPGVNRFFLEQEAKIKTDKILALHKNHTPKV